MLQNLNSSNFLIEFLRGYIPTLAGSLCGGFFSRMYPSVDMGGELYNLQRIVRNLRSFLQGIISLLYLVPDSSPEKVIGALGVYLGIETGYQIVKGI